MTGQCESQGNGEETRRGRDSLEGADGRKSQCAKRVGGDIRGPWLGGARAGPRSPQGGPWPLPGDKAPPGVRPVDGVLSSPPSVTPALPGPEPGPLPQAPPLPDASRAADEAAWVPISCPGTCCPEQVTLGSSGSSPTGEGACRGRPQLEGPSVGQALLSRTPMFSPVTGDMGPMALTPRDGVATRPAGSLRTRLVRGRHGRAA